MSDPTSPSVSYREAETPGGQRIGFAELNAEKSLNALTLEMIRSLTVQLHAWAADPRIAMVVLSGAGERAFCAGADIRRLYADILAKAEPLPGVAFFAEEYRLDHFLHRYPKPLLVWGSGVTMGGGIGLMAGASHRIVTETSRLAMPETQIGLFPDVGASRFLGRLPRGQGTFIGMTGVALNAHDALVARLADHFISASDRVELWQRLETTRWSVDAATNAAALNEVLASFARSAAARLPASQLEAHAAYIESVVGSDFKTTYRRIVAYAGGDPWIAAASATLRAGSPTSAALSWELPRRLANASVADVFRLELSVAVHCCTRGDFTEGVRALLVDKDNAPRWSPSDVEDVSREWLESFLAEPRWPSGSHPLADLRSPHDEANEA